MRQVIRNQTFETNSSSVHTLVILNEEEKQKYDSGNYIFSSYADEGKDRFITKEDLLQSKDFKEFKKEFMEDNAISENYFSERDQEDCINEYCRYNCYDYLGNDDYYDEDELEEDWNEYTSEHGDKIYIRCRYGRDG